MCVHVWVCVSSDLLLSETSPHSHSHIYTFTLTSSHIHTLYTLTYSVASNPPSMYTPTHLHPTTLTHSRVSTGSVKLHIDSGVPHGGTLVPPVIGSSQHPHRLPSLEQGPLSTRDQVVVYQQLSLKNWGTEGTFMKVTF